MLLRILEIARWIVGLAFILSCVYNYPDATWFVLRLLASVLAPSTDPGN